MVILLDRADFASWGSCIGEGLLPMVLTRLVLKAISFEILFSDCLWLSTCCRLVQQLALIVIDNGSHNFTGFVWGKYSSSKSRSRMKIDNSKRSGSLWSKSAFGRGLFLVFGFFWLKCEKSRSGTGSVSFRMLAITQFENYRVNSFSVKALSFHYTVAFDNQH